MLVKLGETLLHSDDVMFVFEDKVKLKLQTKYTNKTRYFKDIIHGWIVNATQMRIMSK